MTISISCNKWPHLSNFENVSASKIDSLHIHRTGVTLLWFIGNYILSSELMQKQIKHRKRKRKENNKTKFCMELCRAAFWSEIDTRFWIPDALHSSSSFSKLCSRALIEGSINRLDWFGRGLDSTDSDSRAPPSFTTGTSPLLCTVADTHSFHNLPSYIEKLEIRVSNP
jgi:hypothetical protein